MKSVFFTILLLTASQLTQAGPAPYCSAKIYIVENNVFRYDDLGKLRGLTPQEIRDSATIKIDIDTTELVPWFYSLKWRETKHRDPTVKQWAKPLIMIIDLYERVQPEPPAKPLIDTLYCTDKYAYSDENDYIDITPFISNQIKLPLTNHLGSKP